MLLSIGGNERDNEKSDRLACVLYCAFRGRHSNGRRSGGNRRIKRSIHDRLSGGVSSAPLEYPILRLGVLASAPSDNYANNGGYVDIAAESKF